MTSGVAAVADLEDIDLEDAHSSETIDSQSAFFSNSGSGEFINDKAAKHQSQTYVQHLFSGSGSGTDSIAMNKNRNNASTNDRNTTARRRYRSPDYFGHAISHRIRTNTCVKRSLPMMIKVRNALLMLPSLFIVFIISFVVYCTLFLAMPFRYNQALESSDYLKQSTTFLLALLFTIFATLTMTSFLRCVFTSTAVKDNPPSNNNKTNVNNCRICNRCSQLKPQRAHHCSICGTCVLKMDHHCPWVSNCVGYFNYKYFILFIWSATLACHISSLICLSELYQIVGGYHHSMQRYDGPHSGWVMINSLLSMAFGVTLTCFSFFHGVLVFQGTTTIEFGRNNEYSQGWKGNFCAIFGDNKVYWFLPLATMKGDGYEYSANAHLLQDVQYHTTNTNENHCESDSDTDTDVDIEEQR